jgi:nucleoside-diphosphate-sugar epimerase
VERILLTGATGFIGSDVLTCLLKQGFHNRITLLGRKRPTENSLVGRRLKAEGIDPSVLNTLEFEEAHFSDSESLGLAIERLKKRNQSWIVVHLAALIHSKGDLEAQTQINLGATRALLAFANQTRGRFVYTSSVVVFGVSASQTLRSENDFPRFSNVSRCFDYFVTKREAHLAVEREAQIPTVILCPSIVHGAFEGEKDSRGHLRALEQRRLTWAPSGGGNFVSLRDVSEAILKTISGPIFPGVQVRLVIGENLTYQDYFTRYVKLFVGASAPKIRTVPRWLGYLVLMLFRIAREWLKLPTSVPGLKALEGLAQGTLYLWFRSESPSSSVMSVEKALQEAYVTRE